jgi:hypothetical protein
LETAPLEIQEPVEEMMDPQRLRVIGFLALGLSAGDIAETLRCSPSMVHAVKSDPETAVRIERIRNLARTMGEIRRKSFDQLLDCSLNVMFDVLTSPKAKMEQKMRAALAVFDRHPDGEFAKTAKRINREELSVGLDSETLSELKRIASRTNRENVIDISSFSPSPSAVQPPEALPSSLSPMPPGAHLNSGEPADVQ